MLIVRHIEITNHATLILAVFSPYLLLAIPIVGAVHLLRRRWIPAASAGLASVVLAAVLLPHPMPGTEGSEVRVMTANLLQGNADARAVVDLARDHADVVSLQELTPESLKRLSANGIDAAFPYRITKALEGGSGAGLWSRHPLQETGAATEANPITARVNVSGSPTVAVVHLSAPWPWPIDWWRNDIAQVTSTLDHLSGPVIVAGDFNSTRDMAQFRHILDNGFRDADLVAPTYPADSWVPPLLPIDHILTRGASSSDPWTAAIPGSDHRALLATIQVPQ